MFCNITYENILKYLKKINFDYAFNYLGRVEQKLVFDHHRCRSACVLLETFLFDTARFSIIWHSILKVKLGEGKLLRWAFDRKKCKWEHQLLLQKKKKNKTKNKKKTLL